MPYRLALPKTLAVQGWKVKIQDKERLEPPHVTVLHRQQAWRIDLRTGGFMVPPGGNWREIHAGLRALVQENWEALCTAWDAMYPHNPVCSAEHEDDA